MKNIVFLLSLIICKSAISQLLTNTSTWKPIQIPLNGTQKIFFWSSDSGLAFGNNNEAKLIRTYDGGNTWITIFDLAVYTNSNIVYTCAIQIKSKSEIGLAFWDNDSFLNFTKTYDGGNTWEKHKSVNHISSQCTDILFNGDTLIINSSKIKPQNDTLPSYKALQVSITNGEYILKEIPFGSLIRFASIPNTNLSIIYSCYGPINPETHGSVYTSLKFIDDISKDKLSYPWCPSDYHYEFFPLFTDISKGYFLDWNSGLFKFPVNNLPTDSFYSCMSCRPSDNVFEALWDERFYRGFCVSENKLALTAYRNIFMIEGSTIKGAHLPFKNNQDVATCINYGTQNVGYIGTSSNYIFKTMSGMQLNNINNEALEFNFQLFPNPAQNQITLANYSLQVHSNYHIYNLLGTLVQQGNLEEKETIININSLAEGLYFIRVGDTTLKFVKGKD